MAQMELAMDVVFKRSAPLRALFQRACELGVLVGGAIGQLISSGDASIATTTANSRPCWTSATFGHPVLRWYYQTSFAKQYVRGDQHSDRILRNETCSNDHRHFGVGRRSKTSRCCATNCRHQ